MTSLRHSSFISTWARALAPLPPHDAHAARPRDAGHLRSFVVGFAIALFFGDVIDLVDLSLVALFLGATWSPQ